MRLGQVIHGKRNSAGRGHCESFAKLSPWAMSQDVEHEELDSNEAESKPVKYDEQAMRPARGPLAQLRAYQKQNSYTYVADG